MASEFDSIKLSDKLVHAKGFRAKEGSMRRSCCTSKQMLCLLREGDVRLVCE